MARLAAHKADGVRQLAAVRDAPAPGEPVLGGAAVETNARHRHLQTGRSVRTVADEVARLATAQAHLQSEGERQMRRLVRCQVSVRSGMGLLIP